MTDDTALTPSNNAAPASILTTVGRAYGISGGDLYETLAETIFPTRQSATKQQVQALLIVANQYKLNPFTREIYAFPAKGKGVVPIVSIDGWLKLANEHPQFDGLACEPNFENGELVSYTATIWRKDRTHPLSIVETLSENQRSSDPWKQRPNRMLRHRAAIQAIRYAFGFAGIYEPEEGSIIAHADGDRDSSKVVPLDQDFVVRDVEEAKQVEEPTPAPEAVPVTDLWEDVKEASEEKA